MALYLLNNLHPSLNHCRPAAGIIQAAALHEESGSSETIRFESITKHTGHNYAGEVLYEPGSQSYAVRLHLHGIHVPCPAGESSLPPRTIFQTECIMSVR